MRHLYILFLFALLAGCDHDRSFPDTAVPVQIVPSLDHVAPGGTRVIDQTWQSNDVVGVSIDNRTTFKTYKPSGTVPGTNVTLIPMADPLYYPTNDDEVTFTAFCPYKAPVNNMVTYDAFTDQSESALMQAVDLIYHYGAKGRKSTATTPVSMSFQHKFSKVVITATRGANVSEDLNNLTMTLTGMPTSTTFDLRTGTPGTASGSDAITPEHYSKAAATTTARAIIAPHAGIANRTITFSVGSLNYSYPIPAGFEFETGKEYTFDFTLTQKAPELSSTTIVAWNSGTIAWDGAGSSLTAPTEVTHYKEASTGNKMVIKTNHANNPGVSSTVSWLTGLSLSAASGSNPKTYTLTYNVAANGTGADRTGNIEITVGTMTVVTTVTQSAFSFEPPEGASNCFIVAPGGVISFPLTRPIALGRAASNATFTMQVLWADANCISGTPTVTGTGSNARLNVTATSTAGNALIAVKVGSTIVWSYHIWVTNYNPNAATFANNGLIFMDRNLGATTVGMPASDITGTSNTTGLYYQWGRKDPFPATGAPGATQPGGGSFTAVQTSASLGTVDNTIKNPSVFYFDGNQNSYDWHWGSRNNELWGHTDGSKTVYDPCPAGWRVPRYTSGTGSISDATSPWNGFTTAATWTDKRGRNFGTNAYYQASGYRSYGSGALGSVGNYGAYWSASPDSSTDNNAGILNFDSSGVNPANTSIRASGNSVRCVQE